MPRKTASKTVAAPVETFETPSMTGMMQEILQEMELETVSDTGPEGEFETMSDETLAALVSEADELLQADEQVDEVQADEVDQGEVEEPQASFADLILSCDPAETETMVFAIAAEIDAREAFERDKAIAAGQDPDGINILKTLKKARAELVTKRAAKVLLATNVEPDLINREISSGSRYNVYALGKLADLVRGLTDGEVGNAINRACMKSLFAFSRAGLTFNMEIAKAAASDKIRIEPTLRKHLISHTVSASTAPTQASSTMQAAETLGIVRVVGSRKNPVYQLTDHPIVAKLEEVLRKAA